MDVLVVEPVHAEVLQWLDSRHRLRLAPELADDPVGFRIALSGARAAIVPPYVTVDASVLWHAPELRVLGRVSAGAENIDLEACARAGVEVARAGSASASAEAEFVVGALLALLRRMPIVSADGMLVGRELGGRTVGLIGATPTTECLARLLTAFGVRVQGYDPGLHASEPAWAALGVQPVALQDLMASSDAVCVLLTHYARFNGLLGERLLGAAKPNQVIVSLAHSAIFDEHALALALTRGPLAAAWLDSLEPGTLDPGRPLRHIDTLQVTPRVASTTEESRLRSAWVVAERIDAVLNAAPVARPGAPLVRPRVRGGRAGPANGPGPV